MHCEEAITSASDDYRWLVWLNFMFASLPQESTMPVTWMLLWLDFEKKDSMSITSNQRQFSKIQQYRAWSWIYRGHANETRKKYIKFSTGTLISFGIRSSQQSEYNCVVCCLMACLQHDDARHRTVRHAVTQIQHLESEVLHKRHIHQI